MNTRRISLVMSLALIVLLTGCWDRRELNTLAISVALGIDKVENEYQVTVQVVQPSEVAAKKDGTSSSTPVTRFQARGVTLFEALRKMTTVSSRKIYSAHLRIAVFGEDLAKEGIGNTLDILSRDYELRTDFYLLVAKGTTASNALDILTPLDKIPANKMFGSIETSEKVWAPVMAVTLDEFMDDYESMGKNPVLSGIRVRGNEEKGKTKSNLDTIRPAARLQNSALAVFRRDKLLGWLSEEESKGYNYIVNNVHTTVGHVECPGGGNVALEIIDSKSKMKGSMADGKPQLAVEINVEENVGEVQCLIDLTKPETIRELEKRAKQTLEGILSQTIRTAQRKFKNDFLGFGNAIHRSDPAAWKTVKEDWDELFQEAEVDITVNVKIKRTGTTTNSFLKREE